MLTIEGHARADRGNLPLEDFQHRTLALLRRRDLEERADRIGDPSLLADDLAHVFLGDLQLENNRLLPDNLSDSDLVRVFHECLGDVLDELFHRALLATMRLGPTDRSVGISAALIDHDELLPGRDG